MHPVYHNRNQHNTICPLAIVPSHCTIVPSCHCIIKLAIKTSYHQAIIPLSHVPSYHYIVPMSIVQSHLTNEPLCHSTIEPCASCHRTIKLAIIHRIIVPCTILPLHHAIVPSSLCTIKPLYHCAIVSLSHEP